MSGPKIKDIKTESNVKDVRRLAGNLAEVIYQNGTRAIRHWHTDILIFNTDGSIKLNNGGHYSATTKKHLNAFLPQGYRVIQRNHEWFLVFESVILPYANGMKITNK